MLLNSYSIVARREFSYQAVQANSEHHEEEADGPERSTRDESQALWVRDKGKAWSCNEKTNKMCSSGSLR